MWSDIDQIMDEIMKWPLDEVETLQRLIEELIVEIRKDQGNV